MVKRRQTSKSPIKVLVKPKKKSSKPVTQGQMTRLGTALRYLGGLGGGAVGSLVGAPTIGSGVGSSLGAALSKWLGSGDYTVGSNSIVKSSLKAASSIPMMHNESQSVIIRHREYLGEIRSSTNYTVQQSFTLNPGDRNTFPWLSGIAANFQEYSFKGVVFHYIPSSGAAITTSPSLGTVMLQTSYRSTDTAPESKVELLNEYCSNEVVPSETMAHPIECDPKENPFNVQYVRTSAPPAGETRLMYDLGVTHVATSGQTSSGYTLGDLWVTYEVELKKPLVLSNVTQTFESAAAYCAGALTGASFFDATTLVQGNLPIIASGRRITFPRGAQGRWVVTVYLNAQTGFANPSWIGLPTLTNCSTERFVYSAPGVGISYAGSLAPSATTVSNVYAQAGIRITEPHAVASIEFATPTLGGTVSYAYVTVTPMVDLSV